MNGFPGIFQYRFSDALAGYSPIVTVGSWHREDKFLASISSGDISNTARILKDLSDYLQYLIADDMTIGVVD